MRVEELMTKSVRTCRPEDSLNRAAQIMWDHDCGAVPVVSSDGEGRLVGMITDRDLSMAAYTRGRTLGEIAVQDVMARDLQCCQPADTLAEAEHGMRRARVRRLPVVDESGHVVGLLSLADLAREAAKQRGSKRPTVREKEVAETLAAICEPRQATA
jgi:CBS-domain-containing membrane protein